MKCCEYYMFCATVDTKHIYPLYKYIDTENQAKAALGHAALIWGNFV